MFSFTCQVCVSFEVYWALILEGSGFLGHQHLRLQGLEGPVGCFETSGCQITLFTAKHPKWLQSSSTVSVVHVHFVHETCSCNFAYSCVEGNYVPSHMAVRLWLNNGKCLSYCMLILNCAVVARPVTPCSLICQHVAALASRYEVLTRWQQDAVAVTHGPALRRKQNMPLQLCT